MGGRDVAGDPVAKRVEAEGTGEVAVVDLEPAADRPHPILQRGHELDRPGLPDQHGPVGHSEPVQDRPGPSAGVGVLHPDGDPVAGLVEVGVDHPPFRQGIPRGRAEPAVQLPPGKVPLADPERGGVEAVLAGHANNCTLRGKPLAGVGQVDGGGAGLVQEQAAKARDHPGERGLLVSGLLRSRGRSRGGIRLSRAGGVETRGQRQGARGQQRAECNGGGRPGWAPLPATRPEPAPGTCSWGWGGNARNRYSGCQAGNRVLGRLDSAEGGQ